MLRYPSALLLFLLFVSFAGAATHRLIYTFDVTFGAPAFGVNTGDQVLGWIDFDASVPDGNPSPTVGAYQGSFVDYGFTSHAFVTPLIDWSAVIVDNNRLSSGTYWAGHLFSFQTVGGPGPHLKKVDLAAWHSGAAVFGFMTNDFIPTTSADVTTSIQYGSTLRFVDSGVETSVDGLLTAVEIRTLAVPEASSTLALLSLAMLAAVVRRTVPIVSCFAGRSRRRSDQE